MAEQSELQVRVFTRFATHIAGILNCSYEDAAVFLVKIGPLVTLLSDKDFQDKLTRYATAIAKGASPVPTEATPQGKGIH